jgi:hypothetical protein
MAPSCVEDSLVQLITKVDEGNKESIQTTMEKMEVTVQGLVNDRGEFQRWQPSIEKKVIDMTEALTDICSQVNKAGQKTIGVPPPLPTSEAMIRASTSTTI